MGATLFAVDGQTNAYATTGGKVIKLSGAGIPLQTNAICPLSGLAQRDESGNFYFAGSFHGTQDFGGIVLDGGISWPSVDPSGFLAKYDPQGKLLWAVKYGSWEGAQVTISSLALNPKGGCYLAYIQVQEGPSIPPPTEFRDVASFSTDGTLQFESTAWIGPGPNTFDIGAVTESNFWAFSVSDAAHALPMLISASGTVQSTGVVPPPPLVWNAQDWYRGKPVVDALGQVFLTGLLVQETSANQQLRKFGVDGSVLWSVDLDAEPRWTLARDAQGIYLGGSSNSLSKLDFDGTLIWQTNYEQTCLSMIVDLSGNQFLSFADGSVGRLTTDLKPIFGLKGDGFALNGFEMTVTSAPGSVVEILGSDDFKSWRPLGFVTNTTGTAVFIDSQAPGSSSCFYKARAVSP